MPVNSKDIQAGLMSAKVEYIGVEGGSKLFQLAPGDVVDAISKKDPRVGYRSFRAKWLEHVSSQARRWNADRQGSPPSALLQQAQSKDWAFDFARNRITEVQKGIGRPVYVRGVATYLDAEVSGLQTPESKFTLFGPAAALKFGRERKEMQSVPTHLVGDDRIAGWVSQSLPWLFKHPQDVREELERLGFKEQADKVFPMAIFFDGDPNHGGKPIKAEIFDYVEVPIIYGY